MWTLRTSKESVMCLLFETRYWRLWRQQSGTNECRRSWLSERANDQITFASQTMLLHQYITAPCSHCSLKALYLLVAMTVIGTRRYTECREAVYRSIFTARCTIVQSAVLRSHVVCPSACPSVRLSVTLVDCDHIGWKSWKLIARTISPTPSLFVAKRRSTYSQWNMGKFGGD